MDERVLIVEDDETLLETLEYNLTRQGYETPTATDGLAALDVARQEHPDLIVLDISLPGIDGFEVCRILRREMSTALQMPTKREETRPKTISRDGSDEKEASFVLVRRQLLS